MKRFLLILLSVLMLVSTLNLGVFANPVGFTEKIEYDTNEWITKDELAILNKLRITEWADISEMGARNSEVVTRWYAAQQICKLARLDVTETAGYETLFKDLTSEHKYYNEVKAAVKAGYMKGNADGYFRPDEAVTVRDVASMLLRVLGYEPYIGIMGEARMLGETDIFKGIPSNEQTITQAQFLKMIFNALNSPAIRQGAFEKYKDGGYDVTYMIDDTYLGFEHLFGVKHEMAVLDGVQGTTLEQSGDSVRDGYIAIAGVDYLYQGDAEQLLGYKVDYYFTQEDDQREIVYLCKSDDNMEFVLNYDEIDSFSQGVYTYADGNKTKELELSPDVRVIYNDIANPDYTDAEMVPSFGTVTFINNDGKKGYEVVKVVNYEFYFSSSINAETQKITDMTGNTPRILETGNCDSLRIISGENEIAFGRLKKSNLLVVKRSSKNSKYDKLVIEAFKVSKKGIKITSIKEDSIASGNSEYDVWDAIIPELRMGKTYDLYMFENKVVLAVEDEGAGAEYAVLAGMGIDGNAFSKYARFAIVDMEGNFAEYEGAEKIYLDGTVFSNYDSLKNRLAETALLYSNGYTPDHSVSQPVKISFNSLGQVHKIDTYFYDAEKEEETSLQKAIESTGKTNYYSSYSRTLYNLVEGTTNQYKVVVASVPESDPVLFVPSDRFEEDSYVVKYFSNGDIYCVDVLGRDEDSYVADALIVYYDPETSGIGSTTGHVIVSDLSSEMVDDEVVYTVKGYRNTSQVTYTCDESLFKELSIGDVYRFETDRTNKIIAISKIYDIDDDFPAEGGRQTFSTNSSSASGTGSVFGSLIDVDGSFIRVSQTLTTDADGIDPTKNVDNFHVSSSVGVYRYSVIRGMPVVEPISLSDAVPYTTDKETPSLVMLNCVLGLKQVYFIEK